MSDFDVTAWADRHAPVLTGRAAPSPSPPAATRLHNPYAGVPYAWQLTESVDAFLARLPPSTTTGVPWIFICNPYIPRVGKRVSDMVQTAGRGNEDEAPQEPGSDVAIVAQGGLERLGILQRFIQRADRANVDGRSVPAVVQQDLAREIKQATADVLNLAHAYKVRAGKWMLFVPPRDVDEVWAVVARATADNELGIAAKVAVCPGIDEDRRRDRLICVYTADFRDTADVARVVRKLRALGLVETKGPSIYYKPGKTPRMKCGTDWH